MPGSLQPLLSKRLFRPGGLILRKPNCQKTRVLIRTDAPAFASFASAADGRFRFSRHSLSRCSQNHSLSCESAVISGRDTLAALLFSSTVFFDFFFRIFRFVFGIDRLAFSSASRPHIESHSRLLETKTGDFFASFKAPFSPASRPLNIAVSRPRFAFASRPLSRRGGIDIHSRFFVHTFDQLFSSIGRKPA